MVICVKRLIILIGAVCILFCGCTPTVNGPRDELRLYDWVGEFDNGNKAELSFCDSIAAFTVDNSDDPLDIIGLCSLTDDSIVIIDDVYDMSYEFDYQLHGDCVELCYRGDSITLKKKVEK